MGPDWLWGPTLRVPLPPELLLAQVPAPQQQGCGVCSQNPAVSLSEILWVVIDS